MGEVAYKPISDIIPPKILQEVNDKDLTNYKDVGVEFQGYSKIKISGNQYKLLRQEAYFTQTIFGWTASNASLSLTINPEFQKKSFYIKSIHLESTTNIANAFILYDTQGKIIFIQNCISTNPINQVNIRFDVPIKFDTQAIFIQPTNLSGVSVAITGNVVINFYGYYEDRA